MEYIRKKVLTDDKWRMQTCCCCCGIKTGTTVIGVLTVINATYSIVFPALESEVEAEDDRDSVVKTIQGQTMLSWIVASVINVIRICLSGTMVYGNIKGKTKLMIPYLYVQFICISIIIILGFTAALAYIFDGDFKKGFFVILGFGIVNVIFLYFWHVVRCRSLDIDDIDQPGEIGSQRDPELPAYGDVQGANATAQGGYGYVQGTYGDAQGTHGYVQGTYGNPQGTYGNAQGTYGNAQGTYGNAQGTYGNVQGTYGDVQGIYGNVQSINEMPQGEPPVYSDDRHN